MRSLIVAMVCLLIPSLGLCAEGRFVQLTGWGGGKPEETIPQAAAIGFNEIIVTSHDRDYLTRAVALGRQHNIAVYTCVHLSDLAGWKKQRPGLAPPLQEMNPAENAARERIAADKSKGKSGYQFGGEPVQDLEVLITPLLCFHHADIRPFFEEQIRDLLQVAGLRGIALDFFGYQNYRCCRCETSRRAQAAWQQRHPEVSTDRASDRFALETLVDFTNALARYARSVRPDAKVACHVYPVFLPEPLYGNRLDVDSCGQTAAWFFEPFWSEAKIRDYTRVIVGQEKKYFAQAEGVPMLGFYAKPALYSVKSGDRLTLELQAILAGGGDRLQVCSFNDVLNDPAARQIFLRFFGPATPTPETCLRLAGDDFIAQLPWFYHGLPFQPRQDHNIYSFEVNALPLPAGKYTVAIATKGKINKLEVGFDGRTFSPLPVQNGRTELPDVAIRNRMLSFYLRAPKAPGSPLQSVLVVQAGKNVAEAQTSAIPFRAYQRKTRLEEREILQKEHWNEFHQLLCRPGFGKTQLRAMFEEIVQWCLRRQVLDPHDAHYGAIHSEEDKYDFRDAAAAAICFAYAWRDSGNDDYRRRALLARSYVAKGQHREDPANKAQYGGFCQMVDGKWGPPFRRLGHRLPNVTGVETCIIANLLVKSFELGLDPAPGDIDCLHAAVTWLLNNEFQPGVFHHHQGSTTDCQNSNILAAMALGRAGEMLEKLGRPAPPGWREAARRGCDHFLEGQEAIGCWPYLFASIGRGQAFREQNLPDQGMGVYHFLVAADTSTLRARPGIDEALRRAARWWLAVSRIDREPPFPTIDLDDRLARGDLKFSAFTWCRFMAAASLTRIALRTGEEEPWRQLALRYLEHVHTKLWNRTDPSKAPVRRATRAQMTLCSWIQAAEWDGVLLREIENGLP